MMKFMQAFTAVAVALFMTKCCNSQPPPEQNLNDLQFMDLPDNHGDNPLPTVSADVDSSKYAICKNGNDNVKARQYCRELSKNFRGDCRELLMKTVNEYGLGVLTLRWTAVCYGKHYSIAGCLTETVPLQGGYMLRWRIRVLGDNRYCEPYKKMMLMNVYEGSPVVGQYFNCTEPFREDNLNVVICLSLAYNARTLPRNISTNIQVNIPKHLLDIKISNIPKTKSNLLELSPQGLYILSHLSLGTLVIEDIDTFQRFPNLVKLQMIMRRGLEISEKLLEPDQLSRLQNELFSLPHLEALGISHVEFNSKGHPWVLPASLKVLLVSNSIFEFDLRKCSLLEMLELHNNDLHVVPTLSNPPPPLKWLNLSRNPLRKVGLNDIAEHCDLRILELDRANMSYCECLRLLHWIRKSMKEMEEFMFSGSLECDYVEDQDCSGYTLQEAESLRQRCVYHRIWDVIIWIFGIFALWAVVILACFLIGYKLRRMRALRESSEE